MNRWIPMLVMVPGLLACSGVEKLRTADGRKRTFEVHLPPQHEDGGRLPVVLALHGGGGNAEGLRDTIGLDEVADDHGFVAVYPNGTGKKVLGTGFYTWNGGVCCGDAADAYGSDPVDDVAFFAELLDHLEAEYRIDPEQVYVTGISNGGLMAHRLACELPGRIAAIAPVASPGPVPEWCAQGSQVPVLVIHGTDDPCALWDGGEACGGCFASVLEELYGVQPDPNAHFPCMSVPDQVTFWQDQNACDPGSSETTFEAGDGTCVEHRDCGSGAPVGLCTVDGGGHAWPGGELGCQEGRKVCDAYADVTGKISTDLVATEVMWSFFEDKRATPGG